MKHSTLLVITFLLYSFSNITIGQCVIADYSFTSNALDSSGNNYHGIVNGASLTTDRNGNINSAYSFDGVDDFIEMGNIIDLSSLTELTISAWFNPSSSFGSNNLFTGLNIGKRSTGRIVLRMTDSNENQYEGMISNTDDVNATAMNSVSQIDYNNWTHVVAVYRDANVEIYINGVSENNPSSAGSGGVFSAFASNLELNIGKGFASNDAERFYFGKIDDIKIYDCALTANEITSEYLAAEELENSSMRFNIYPNPATNQIVINGELTSRKVVLVNSLGQSFSVKQINNVIDISTFAEGMYYLLIMDEKGGLISTEKIVKTK